MSNNYLICDLITNNINKDTNKAISMCYIREYHDKQKAIDKKNKQESVQNKKRTVPSISNLSKSDRTLIQQSYCEKIFQKLYDKPITSSVKESFIKQAPFLIDFVEKDELTTAISKIVLGHYDEIYTAMLKYVFPKYIAHPEGVPNMYIGYSTQDCLLTLYVVRNESQAGTAYEFNSFLNELEDIFRQPMGIYVTTQIPIGKDLNILKRDLKKYSVGIYKRSKCISPNAYIYSRHFREKYLKNTDKRFKDCDMTTNKRAVVAPSVSVGAYFSNYVSVSPYVGGMRREGMRYSKCKYK